MVVGKFLMTTLFTFAGNYIKFLALQEEAGGNDDGRFLTMTLQFTTKNNWILRMNGRW